MPRKVKVADLFCGAGGSSTGATQAIRQLGREIDLVCVNPLPASRARPIRWVPS